MPDVREIRDDGDLLRAIVEAVESETGDGFHRSLVRSLAVTLEVQYAFVSELTRGGSHFRSLVLYARGEFADNFEVPLAGTPCEAVLGGQAAFYPDELQRRFPADRGLVDWCAVSYGGVPMVDAAGRVVGHLAFMHDQPLSDGDRALSVMRIFAARAVAEIDRQRAEARRLASEARFGRILDAATDAVASFDAVGAIRYANEAASRVLRAPISELTRSRIERFTGGDAWRRIAEVIEDFDARPPGAHYLSEREGLRAVRADGDPFPFEATLSRSSSSDETLFTLILRDVGQRQAAEREMARLQRDNEYLREELREVHGFDEIVGRSESLRRVLEEVELVAPTDASVLIQGETGTGKELVARAIHARSRRSERPLVKVNCAALAPGVLESELFGHERGAFTGATQRRIGRFELADGGTLFLDEVGELPLDVQAKLLRVLQEREFERLGGNQTLEVDVRVIAATNRDLGLAIAEGRFREDLHYRLNVFPVRLPPLRERAGDVPLLVEYFVHAHAARVGRRIDSISPESLERLSRYAWPGNVRELQNLTERAVILCRGGVLEIGPELLGEDTGSTTKTPAARPAPARDATLEEVERRHILATLESTRWRVDGPRGAAQILGLPASTLRSRMHRLGIDRSRDAGS